MQKPTSSLIVSPNLGCPEIVTLPETREGKFRVVIATPMSEDFDLAAHTLSACPSFSGEGQEFMLELVEPLKLVDEGLPSQFYDLGETRLLISTTLRTQLFPGYAFWTMWARPRVSIGRPHFRTVKRRPCSTLYDLALSVKGLVVGRVRHALCLRVRDSGVKFVHLTDLHVAARNDMWEAEVRAVIEGSHVTPGQQRYENFNGRLREFIRWANQAADDGQLDFIWALGDLVDFCRTGLFDRTPDDSNWSTLIEILTASAAEVGRGNPGLRVPIFTSTGNHDWRTYPYSPAFRLDIFGITKKCADELDFWYRNTSVEIGRKLEEVNQRLIRKGSPLLARSWWGTVANMGVRGLLVGGQRLWQRIKAVGVSYGRQMGWVLLGVGSLTEVPNVLRLGLRGSWQGLTNWAPQHDRIMAVIIVFVVGLLLATFPLPSWLYAKLRTTLEGLIAIEAEVSTLSEYFLRVNPYFNYAFQLDNCYFIVLDTGPDCLTAQSFWDEGGKKVRRISIRDNIIGGSPDTMGFYPANEFYPYSQIAWLDNVLLYLNKSVTAQKARIFVGLHAPPANLSSAKQREAEQQLQLAHANKNDYVVMKKGGLDGYDIAFGTVNHYLSQFFYLCLGYREDQRQERTGPGIDAVFAGHAHWNMEFEMRKPKDAGSDWSPELLYGKFSRNVEAACHDQVASWGPLLLQTAACGPQGPIASEVPPNFRYVTVSTDGTVCNLRPRNLSDRPQLGVSKAAAGVTFAPQVNLAERSGHRL